MSDTLGMDPSKSKLSFNAIATYAIAALVVCLPIWYVDNFYSADGPPHLHSASLMLDLAAGQTPANGFYSFNSVLVPNSLGHWILAAFLTIFSAGTASKLMATGLFCLFVAGVAWLRDAISGSAGLWLVILLAGAVGLNRLWLVGLYNFLLGVIIVLFAAGLLVRWEGRLTVKRAGILAVAFALSYCSHLISFGVLGLWGGLYILTAARKERVRSLALFALAAIPILPLFIWYQLMGAREGAMSPVWYLLNEPSLANLVLLARAVDPIFIISRRYIPFLEVESPAAALASPIIWIAVACCILAGVAWFRGKIGPLSKSMVPFMIPTAVLFLLVLIAPDELGSSEGSVIRPRFFLIALAFLIAVLPIPSSKSATSLAAAIVVAVLGYQTLGLWEYSLRYDREISEFIPVTAQLADGERFASVMVFDEQLRFHPSPTQRVASLAGIEKDVVVWDTYEAGYYFFSVIAANPEDREAIRRYSNVNVVIPTPSLEPGIKHFGEQLSANRDKIDVLMVRGRNAQIDALVQEWFGSVPFYETENIRLFRKK